MITGLWDSIITNSAIRLPSIVKVTKVVFPVAGLGTRFLPATKSIPKEMLPIVDKPLIQYAVDEALTANMKTLIFVNGKNKRAIEDYFDRDVELESRLVRQDKQKSLAYLQRIIPPDVACVYMRQFDPLGLGHAISCAAPVVENEAFAVILADDLIDNGEDGSLMQQLIRTYQKYACSVIAVEEIMPAAAHQYGIVCGEPLDDRVLDVSSLVEKPLPGSAVGNLAIVGRYVLTPEVLHELNLSLRGAQGEIQLTDALVRVLKTQRIVALRFSGKRYDCGSKWGYLRANIDMGLRHPDLRDVLINYLKNVCVSAD